MSKLWRLALSTFLLYPSCILGQHKLDSLFKRASLTILGHHGFFITDAPKATYLRDTYSSFIEAGLSFQTDGSKPWHYYNKFPSSGISFFYGNTGSRKYIGKTAGVFPYMKFPVFRYRSFNTLVKAGAGLAWIEKKYDVQNNHKNTLIGSHWNAIINLGLFNEFRITNHLFLNAGLSFTHFSNGTSTLPNLGLNIPAVSAGFRYAFEPTPSFIQKNLKDSSYKGKHINIYGSVGVKQSPWIASERHLIPNIQGEFIKSISPVSNYGAGILLSYDPSLQREIPHAVKDLFDEGDIKLLAGIYAMYEYKAGNVSFPLQAGIYVLNKYSASAMFQNIGVTYKLNSHWSARAQLKTHLGKADYIHIGGGYTF